MRRRSLLIGLGLSYATRGIAADVPGNLDHNVEISPTTLNLQGPGSTTTCAVFNNGGIQTSSQIRLRQWSQYQGQDVLAQTADVVASPPFVTLDPGMHQLVRVANLTAQPAASEMCYRLLLNELPSVGNLTGSGITVLMAFSLPVFVAGADAQPPQLTATFTQNTDARPTLRLTNTGDIHARLTNVSYVIAGRQLFNLPGLVGYVLPHATRDIVLPLPQTPPSGGTLLAQTQLQASPTPIAII
jgi:fimbrial chaperone protein